MAASLTRFAFEFAGNNVPKRQTVFHLMRAQFPRFDGPLYTQTDYL